MTQEPVPHETRVVPAEHLEILAMRTGVSRRPCEIGVDAGALILEMLHERLQRACIEVVVVDGAIVNDKIDGRRNRRVAASRPIYSGQRSDAGSSSRRRGEFGEQLAFIVLIVGMQIEDRETGPDINRKNRRHPRSGSMQARHYRTNAVIQAGRHRHVQVGGDSFAGDCRGKDWMRRELITVGWPVQELELLIRERQQ